MDSLGGGRLDRGGILAKTKRKGYAGSTPSISISISISMSTLILFPTLSICRWRLLWLRRRLGGGRFDRRDVLRKYQNGRVRPG